MKVVIVSANGLHPGFIGCYGNEWIHTPTLDRLAAEGVVFDRHFSDQPNKDGACRAWRTGCFDFPSSQPQLSRTNLLEQLGNHGVRTALVTDGRVAPNELFTPWNRQSHATGKTRSKEILAETMTLAQRELERASTVDKSLVWIDLAALMPPWETPNEYQSIYFEADAATADDEVEDAEAGEPWAGDLPARVESDDDATFLRLQRTFAASVTYFDAALNSFIENLDPGTALIVTSGHGFALGEHERVGDTQDQLHVELVHLPLIVRLPGLREAGLRVAGFTQAVDLMPTVFQLFEIPVPPVHGQSMLPVDRPNPVFRDSACSGWSTFFGRHWALRIHDRALLIHESAANGADPQSPLLFVKPDDRWEVNNVAQHFPEQIVDMEALLRRFVETVDSR